MRLAWISALFDAPESPSTRPRDFTRFDFGVCVGCRGLRAVASPKCTTCGSTAPVTADA